MDLGDYLIVENTWDRNTSVEFDGFMTVFGDRFLVDTHACDLYGFNCSFQFNSILMYAGRQGEDAADVN